MGKIHAPNYLSRDIGGVVGVYQAALVLAKNHRVSFFPPDLLNDRHNFGFKIGQELVSASLEIGRSVVLHSPKIDGL